MDLLRRKVVSRKLIAWIEWDMQKINSYQGQDITIIKSANLKNSSRQVVLLQKNKDFKLKSATINK